MSHFGPKIIVHPQSSGCTLKCISKDALFFKILHNERGQEAYEIYISDFCKKYLVEDEWFILGLKMLFPQNSGSTLKIFL